MSGKSMVIDPLGKIMNQASPTDEQILTVEIDRDQMIDARKRFPLFRDRRPDTYTAITSSTESLY
jgi:N-carbamoylputrescine amidase